MGVRDLRHESKSSVAQRRHTVMVITLTSSCVIGVTPRSRVRCTVHGTVGAYTNTKCHIVVFWRLNWEMINYRTRDLCMRIRVQLSFNKKDMKSIKQVENAP